MKIVLEVQKCLKKSRVWRADPIKSSQNTCFYMLYITEYKNVRFGSPEKKLPGLKFRSHENLTTLKYFQRLVGS